MCIALSPRSPRLRGLIPTLFAIAADVAVAARPRGLRLIQEKRCTALRASARGEERAHFAR
eukprot:5808372-Heterocapsa_arctica.AAC.1